MHIPVYSLLPFVFKYFIVTCGNLGRLAWVRHRATRSALPIPVSVCAILRVSKQCYGCQCLGFLTFAQMLVHSIEHWGCTDTARESALKVDWAKDSLPHQGLEPTSVLRLGFSAGRSTK